ncbi:MAG: tetratricopeptide repeat protein [Sphingopyxis sp.]|nr:tetratricopeptide repeat protein [Sphingopyxis sp.]
MEERLATRPPANAALLQEVDEAVRKDAMDAFARRYGRWIIGLVLIVLLAFGGYLFWQNRQQQLAADKGEALVAAFEKLKAGQAKAATTALTTIKRDGTPAYRAAATIQLANMKAEQGDRKGAAALLAVLAADDKVDQSLRDMALIRQTALEFDALKPELVIARLAPIIGRTDPVSAWYPSAAELTAIAHYQAGRFDQAGALYAKIAKIKDVPPQLQSRAIQMAGMLGVDAVEDPAAAKKDSLNAK